MQVKTLEQQIIEMAEELDENIAQVERYKQYFHIASASNTQLRIDLQQMEEEMDHLVYRSEQLEHEKNTLEVEVIELSRELDRTKEENEYLKGELEDARQRLNYEGLLE